MKSILVIDTPRNCLDCQLMVDGWCYGVKADRTQNTISTKDRTCWCPLKPLPEPKDIGYPNDDYDVGFGDGWDACLKELEK